MHRAQRNPLLFCLSVAAMVLAGVGQLHAEILVFTSGRTLSVKDYQVSGNLVTVTLHGGGLATFDAGLVARVMPDEVRAADVPLPAPVESTSRRVPLEARPFAALIEAVAARHGVVPALVHAVVEAESNYRATARSHVGARGLMQVMPATARDLGVRHAGLLYDPAENLEAGVKYLKFLLDRFGGDLTRALAAYNAGPGAVQKYDGVPPYRETREYVRKVLASVQE